ncbi:aldo/keto reductase [Spirochaetia bacterium]|nr:aldo/keto reductase [Spirochaetia bacterium]GHU34682.1 aldo/keto reductase [Spirochaetia bacterium]
MHYRMYGKTGFQVSALGLGCMRLPRIINEEQGEAPVDREKAYELIRYAADNGVNYFDTAFGYHGTTSEAILGEALAEEARREKVKIVTKQPFAEMKTQGDIRRNLESTLKKLRTDYIDVYLIHNIQRSTWENIKKRKIIEEYEQFRSEGLIRGIGFSYHGQYPAFKAVLDFYDWTMCQIQQNFMDVENEATEEAIRQAGKKGCALVIMEPLRGGSLTTPPPAIQALYGEYPVQHSPVEWSFRHLLNYPEVSTILSGMTTLDQLKENIAIFSKADAVPGCLSPDDQSLLARIRSAYNTYQNIPCTKCEYCMPCPNGVEIPNIFSLYNEGSMFGNFNQPRRGYMFTTRFGHSADKCVKCGLCEQKCPQHIEIIKQLSTAHESLKGWLE